MTMWENFSQNLQQILIAAQVEASKLGVDYIGSEHLILGILNHRHNTACRELKTLGVDLKKLENLIMDKVPATSRKGPISFSFSARATRIIEIAYAFVKSLNHQVIGSEHILLGVLREGNGTPAKILITTFDISYNMVLEELYGIKDLKLANFMESHKFVAQELKLLEENFHKSSVQQQLLNGKVDEMTHTMDYLGDLFESINRPDLKADIMRFKKKVLSALFNELKNGNNSKGKDSSLVSSQGSLMDNGEQKISVEKEKSEKVTAIPVQRTEGGGISITVNIDRSLINDMIKKVVSEAVRENENL